MGLDPSHPDKDRADLGEDRFDPDKDCPDRNSDRVRFDSDLFSLDLDGINLDSDRDSSDLDCANPKTCRRGLTWEVALSDNYAAPSHSTGSRYSLGGINLDISEVSSFRGAGLTK